MSGPRPCRGEPLSPRGGQQAVVKGHELQGRRPSLGREDGCGQLKGVRGAEIVDAQESRGRLAQLLTRFDLVPCGRSARGRRGRWFTGPAAPTWLCRIRNEVDVHEE
jgi:hypothetical protein